jgi:DNA polymerase-1
MSEEEVAKPKRITKVMLSQQEALIAALRERPSTAPRVVVITEEDVGSNAPAWRELLRDVSSASLVAFDTETDSLEHDRSAVGFSVATRPDVGYYVETRSTKFADDTLAVVFEKLDRGDVQVVAHNAKFDIQVLANHGVDLWDSRWRAPWRAAAQDGSYYLTRFHCSMLAAFTAMSDEPAFGLKPLVAKHLGYKMTQFSAFSAWGSTRAIPLGVMAPYAVDDVCQLFELWTRVIFPKLSSDEKFFRIYLNLEIPTLWTLVRLERRGFRIDRRKIEELASVFDAEIAASFATISEIVGVDGEGLNITSPKWLSDVFVTQRAWWPPLRGDERGKSGNYSVDSRHLEAWANNEEKNVPLVGQRVAAELLRYRKFGKLRSTYTDGLLACADRYDRIHSSFNQMGARTGRWSSSNPNLQNIPARSKEGKQIREAFVAGDGYVLIVADYSQIELRLMAHFSQDPNMLRIYREGGDIHQMTADACQCERSYAKGINFGLLYGMGPSKLAVQLGIPESDARSYIKQYFGFYTRVSVFQDASADFARSHGYVPTLLGRRRYLPDIHSRDKGLAAAAARQAVNTRIQGSAADLIKLAMRDCLKTVEERKMLGLIEPISQVHDELIYEVRADVVDDALQIIRGSMESAAKLRVPLVADPHVAMSWGDAK